MNERVRGRNAQLMLVALNEEGKPALAEVLFCRTNIHNWCDNR